MQDHADVFVTDFDRMSTISSAQNVVEGAGGVVFDLLDDPADLKVSVLVVGIGDRQRDPWLGLDISKVVALLGVGQLDYLVCRIPQEPHWIDLRCSVCANSGEVGEQRTLEKIQVTLGRRHAE